MITMIPFLIYFHGTNESENGADGDAARAGQAAAHEERRHRDDDRGQDPKRERRVRPGQIRLPPIVHVAQHGTRIADFPTATESEVGSMPRCDRRRQRERATPITPRS